MRGLAVACHTSASMVEWLASPEMRLGLSLILGLLLGAERERRKRERGTAASAGLRTFAIAGLLGGIAQYSGLPYATVAGGLAVAAFAIAGYVVTAPRESDVGQTTEIAMVLTYALGAMAITAPAVAGTIAIVTTVLLHLRSRLHRFVSETLTDDEVEDALVFLVLAFVVLPLVDRASSDPWATEIGRLVLLRLADDGSIAEAFGPIEPTLTACDDANQHSHAWARADTAVTRDRGALAVARRNVDLAQARTEQVLPAPLDRIDRMPEYA